MPELPEVESVRRSLMPLVGRRITGARLLRADVCTTPTGRRARPADLLPGATITELRRRGKQLALLARDGRVMVVHLGMTGQLLLLPPGARPKSNTHIHATWTFDDDSRLVFRDPRRFGGLWSLPSIDALESRWADIGPDALDTTDLHIATNSHRAIKALLLDQSVLAGVGNIYADEALFRARIRPSRRAHRLSTEELARLAAAIRQVLRSAIDAGGSTLRDYVNANGHTGSAQLRHAVYGRAGQPCLTCGKPLKSSTLTQRTTVYCASCQK